MLQNLQNKLKLLTNELLTPDSEKGMESNVFNYTVSVFLMICNGG